jgi:PKHD-type hydroxylase
MLANPAHPLDVPLIFRRHFTSDECERVLALIDYHESERSSIVDASYSHRSANITWIPRNASTVWLWERMEDLTATINQFLGLDLSHLEPNLQLLQYDENDQFDWHTDMGVHDLNTRKLTIVVQLADAMQYQGGGFEFYGLGELSMSRLRGTVIAFPTFLLHRVQPILNGKRTALVAWCHGPRFR